MSDAKTQQVAIRLTERALIRADALVKVLAEEAVAGLSHTRTDVLRVAIDRGLESLEDEVIKRRRLATKSKRGPKSGGG